MSRAICLYGQREIMEQLSSTLKKHGIDMDLNYYDCEDACKKLLEEPDIQAVLISEYCITGMERGKYECVEAIRRSDLTVRIVVLMNSNRVDHEYENWAFKHDVRDICYPNGNMQYDITLVASLLKSGRLKNAGGNNVHAGLDSGLEDACVPKKNFFTSRKNDKVIPIRDIISEPNFMTDVISKEALDEEEITENLLIEEELRKIRAEEESVKPPNIERVPPPDTSVTASRHEQAPPCHEPPRYEPEPAHISAPKSEVRTVYVDRTVQIGTFVIAVFNLCRGAGATTTACRISDALYKSGRRTALLSFDGKDDLGVVSQRFDYYFADDKQAAASHVIGCGNYEAVVIDFGLLLNIAASGQMAESEMTDKRLELAEFLRCPLKVGMCFTAPWHRDKPRFFLDNANFMPVNRKGGFMFLYDGDPKEIARDYSETTIIDRNAVTIPELFSGYFPWNKRKSIFNGRST